MYVHGVPRCNVRVSPSVRPINHERPPTDVPAADSGEERLRAAEGRLHETCEPFVCGPECPYRKPFLVVIDLFWVSASLDMPDSGEQFGKGLPRDHLVCKDL